MKEQEKKTDDTPIYIGKLSTNIGVRKEMARVYRDSRRGDIPTAEGSKLVYMLKTVGDSIRDGKLDLLEERLEALERSNPTNNSYVCLVRSGEDRDEVVAKFKQDSNVKDGDKLHVVKFVSPETVRRQ